MYTTYADNRKILARMTTILEMYDNIYDTCDELIYEFVMRFPDEPNMLEIYDIASDDKQWEYIKLCYTDTMTIWADMNDADEEFEAHMREMDRWVDSLYHDLTEPWEEEE